MPTSSSSRGKPDCSCAASAAPRPPTRARPAAPPADAGALVDLLHRVGRLAYDHPEIAELDLNPVVASASGCVAVDARVRIEAREHRTRLKGWWPGAVLRCASAPGALRWRS